MPIRQVKAGDLAFAVADDQPTFWDRVEAGRWEPGTLTVLDRLVRPGIRFVDLGAWVGPTALYAAARGARVVAVDPDPAALDQLRRNIAANPSLGNRITVIDRAIHAAPGTVRVGARRKPGDSMSSLLLAGAGTTWTARTLTPAALAARLPRDEPRVIKIDIEGAEYDLLPHLGPLLAPPATAVLLSLHPRILAEQRALGAGEIAARTRAALTVLSGWRAHVVLASGPAPRPEASGQPGTGMGESDEWLFTRA